MITRKSFVGLRIITLLSDFKYTWDELGDELKKMFPESEQQSVDA